MTLPKMQKPSATLLFLLETNGVDTEIITESEWVDRGVVEAPFYDFAKH